MEASSVAAYIKNEKKALQDFLRTIASSGEPKVAFSEKQTGTFVYVIKNFVKHVIL